MKTPLLSSVVGVLLVVGGTASAGHTIVVSTGLQGQANASSHAAGITGDGHRVLFLSNATNLAASDTDGNQDAFVRDLATGAVIHVSNDPFGPPLPPASYVSQAIISRDGSKVFFVSETALDLVNHDADLYMHDMASGATRLLIHGGTGALLFMLKNCSSDGRYVAFSSYAGGLVPQDPGPDQDAFVFDTVTLTTTLVNTLPTGVTLAGPAAMWGVSGDGRFAFFGSDDHYIPTDVVGYDVFRKDLLTGAVIRAHPPCTGAEVVAARDINEDGSVVLLTTTQSWFAADTNGGLWDLVLSDLAHGTIELISVTAAGVVGNNSSGIGTMSADTNWVAFQTQSTNLVPGPSFYGPRILLKDRSTQRFHVCSDPNNGGNSNLKTPASTVPHVSDDGRVVVFDSDATNLCADTTIGTFDVFAHRVRGYFDLGFGVAGTSGVPVLVGNGTPDASTPMSVSLSNTVANSPSLLCVSVTQVPVVTYGGTFVAFPLVLSFVNPTDATGSWSFSVTPPAVPFGNVYMQCLIPDAGATAGVAMSNAIVAALL